MNTKKVDGFGAANGFILRILRTNHPLQEVYVDPELTIGRTVANRIVLDDDPAVDRSHARVVVHGDGALCIACIEDGSVLVPVEITGEELPPVREIKLSNGIRFRIGSAEFDCESAAGRVFPSMPQSGTCACPLCKAGVPEVHVGVQSCPECQRAIFSFRRTTHAATAVEVVPADCGPYRIDGFIAVGGMGLVFHGRHRMTGAEAAIKILREDGIESQSVARFMNETQALAAVKSERTVQLLQSGRAGNFHFLVMEWVNGVSLEEKMDGARKRLERVTGPCIFAWMEGICRGLVDIHAAGIVHRDLKPGNILFTRDGALKISDFGIARRLEIQSSLTTHGKSIGTPRYMSPEQLAASGPVDQRSDQFSLGVIFHELVLGEPPDFAKTDREAVHIGRLKERQLPKDIEAEVLEILERLLAGTPDRRYGDVGSLADRFRAIRGRMAAVETGVTTETEVDPTQVVRPATAEVTTNRQPQQPRQNLFASIACGMLLLTMACLAISGWLWRSSIELAAKNAALETKNTELADMIAKYPGPGPAEPGPAPLDPQLRDELNARNEELGRLRTQYEELQKKVGELQTQLEEEKSRTTLYVNNKKTLYAGIDIGAKGVKGVVVKQSPEGLDLALEDKLKLNASLVDGSGRFTDDALHDTGRIVAEIVERLMTNEKLQGLSRYCFVISSGAVAAVAGDAEQIEALKKRIAQEVASRAEHASLEASRVGLRPRIFPYTASELTTCIRTISADKEAEAGFRGMVQMRRWSEEEANDCILIDVGSGNTKAGYYNFPNGEADAIPFAHTIGGFIPGTITLSGLLDKCQTAEEKEELIKTAVEMPFRESIKRLPRLTNARRAVLAGGAVWALVSLLHPEEAESRVVKITAADIDRFHKLMIDAKDQFPEIEGVDDLSDKARADISSVRNTFTAPQLAAGAAVLKAVARACRMTEQSTEIIFYRDSLYAWIAYVAQQEPQ